MTPAAEPLIAVACGGTGGHLFPGIALAQEFVHRGCSVTLFISPKSIDKQAVASLSGMEIVTLPAVGLSRGRAMAFFWGFAQSYVAARKYFRGRPPRAAVAMGGFTSAPPILAARRSGARTFLHESNTIPGRANRWLARAVDEVFVGFPQAAARFRHRVVRVSGTPVRRQFQPLDAYPCRVGLGLDPSRPVLLVLGGSQGASGINELVMQALPILARNCPELQLLHLTGPSDGPKIESACRALGLKSAVHAFSDRMELAFGAATVAVCRAGASSLAELAAMRVPAVLIPYPAATDQHQLHNARAFEETGAAWILDQDGASPETLAKQVLDLAGNRPVRESMQASLAKWHAPAAADSIVAQILGRSETRACPKEPEGEARGTQAPHPGSAGRGVTAA